MVRSLVLEFFGRELFRCSFTHSLVGGTRVAVRGRTPGAYSGECGTFQWTPAVKAACILFLRSAAGARREPRNTHSPMIVGGRMSPAASLAHALRKPPVWVHDLFGTASGGEPLARRIFRWTAPAAHRSELFSVSLHQRSLSGADVSVFQDGFPDHDAAALDSLADWLTADFEYSSDGEARPVFSSPERIDAPLRAVFEEQPGLFRNEVERVSFGRRFAHEAASLLSHTDIFTRSGLHAVLRRIQGDPSFVSVSDDPSALLAALMDLPCPAVRYGITSPSAQRALADELRRPLRVACALGSPAPLAIFEHLRVSAHLPIDVDTNYAYAIQILHHLVRGGSDAPPDLCAIGLAPAATLMNLAGAVPYRPLMLLPAMSHRVLATRHRSAHRAFEPAAAKLARPPLESGRYLMLRDDPSTSTFYFDWLRRTKRISNHQIAIEHAEPDDVTAALATDDPDVRAILFYPYYDLSRLVCGARLVDQPEGSEHVKDCILFAHENIFRSPSLRTGIETLVRHGWLALRQQPELISRAVDRLLDTSHIVRFLERSCGLGSRSVSSAAE